MVFRLSLKGCGKNERSHQVTLNHTGYMQRDYLIKEKEKKTAAGRDKKELYKERDEAFGNGTTVLHRKE